MKFSTRQVLTVLSGLVLVAIFALRLSDAAERNTLTIDEPHYVGVGLYLWQSDDYHYFETLSFHPPLTHHLAALPLLGLDLGERSSSRSIGVELLSGSDPDPRYLRWLLRMPFIALACWGAFLLFSWAREVAGPGAGLLAICLYTLSPTILANGFLIHSDITVTVFFIQTLYTFWRWWSRPGFARFVLCGISLGLALLSKLSALILLPSLGLLLLVMEYRLWPLAADSRGTRGVDRSFVGSLIAPALKASALGAGLFLIAVGVIWVGYGFSFALNEGLGGSYAGVRLPSIIHALLFDVGANTRGRGIYFMGEVAADGGFWYLLPAAWGLKTPLATLLLLALAAASPRRTERDSAESDSRHPALDPQTSASFIVAVAVMVYLAVVVFWLRVPLGLRYLLPILPLIAFAAALRLAALAGFRRVAMVALVGWLALTGAQAHPHYLSFFNQLAGGSSGAHRFLVDSNFDWGQDLQTLAAEVAERGNPPLWLAYFGPEPPERYGLRAKRLPGCAPVKGMVAISASLLRGLYAVDNPFVAAPAGCYDWLLAREPVAQPGHSILLYEVHD